jgi:hypothetical protein
VFSFGSGGCVGTSCGAAVVFIGATTGSKLSGDASLKSGSSDVVSVEVNSSVLAVGAASAVSGAAL